MNNELNELSEIARMARCFCEQMADEGCKELFFATPAMEGDVVKKDETVLATLREKVAGCRKCVLSKSRNNTVFGAGNPSARLMFIGEAPGAEEDRQGIPFVGRAGKLLTKMLDAIGMSRDEVYITNILKCRPPNNRDPLPGEVECCEPYLHIQLEQIAPDIICALGRHAAQTLLKTRQGIGRLRGRFHDYHGIPLLPTYHPAFLLRSPGFKRKAWEDLQKIRDFLNAAS